METKKELNEPQVAKRFLDLLNEVKYSGLKKVSGSAAIYRTRFWEAVKLKDVTIPRPLVLPDFILIFEDHEKYVDDYLIVAVEIKWFKRKNLDKRLREAYRAFGQPLRNYLYGFDSVSLLHLFDEKIENHKIIEYTETVKSSVEALDLPIVYLAMKLSKDKFRIYQPVNIESFSDIGYTIRYLSRLSIGKRNPLFMKERKKKAILDRRSALKVSLGLP